MRTLTLTATTLALGLTLTLTLTACSAAAPTPRHAATPSPIADANSVTFRCSEPNGAVPFREYPRQFEDGSYAAHVTTHGAAVADVETVEGAQVWYVIPAGTTCGLHAE